MEDLFHFTKERIQFLDKWSFYFGFSAACQLIANLRSEAEIKEYLEEALAEMRELTKALRDGRDSSET